MRKYFVISIKSTTIAADNVIFNTQNISDNVIFECKNTSDNVNYYA